MGLYEFINVVEMRLSKQMTLNSEVSLDTFSKELSLFGVSFGSLVT